MIWLYRGTPGSGKSLSAAQLICKKVGFGKNVITNMVINEENVIKRRRKKKTYGKVFSITNIDMTPENLINYAYCYHKKSLEGQSVVIIDEAQLILSPTVCKLKCQEDKYYRERWIDFLTQHRHFGFDIIFVTQFDRLLDPQIRCLIEYDLAHRKVNSFGLVGDVLSLLGISVFLQVELYYGMKMKLNHRFFTYNKQYASIYDSYSRMDVSKIADFDELQVV